MIWYERKEKNIGKDTIKTLLNVSGQICKDFLPLWGSKKAMQDFKFEANIS